MGGMCLGHFGKWHNDYGYTQTAPYVTRKDDAGAGFLDFRALAPRRMPPNRYRPASCLFFPNLIGECLPIINLML